MKKIFLQKVVTQSSKRTSLKNCIHCGKILENTTLKSIHNFAKHYDQSTNTPFEEKPLIF